MADKTIKNIQDIKLGESVMAYDDYQKKFIGKKVIKLQRHQNIPQLSQIKFLDGTEILLTPGHPLLS